MARVLMPTRPASSPIRMPPGDTLTPRQGQAVPRPASGRPLVSMDTLSRPGSFCRHDDGMDRTYRTVAGPAHGWSWLQDLLVPGGAGRGRRRPGDPGLAERAGRAPP